MRSRIEFFELLSRYRCVDCTGPLLNNTGYLMRSKVHELSAYRYTIAFENTIRPGYVTEKLLEPLAAGSVPIYLGARAGTPEDAVVALFHQEIGRAHV